VLPAAAGTRSLRAHLFTGYWRDIGTIRAFYETHLDLVRPDPPFDFNDPEWIFYTHPRYLPGARLDRTRFTRSILCEGTVLTGCEIEESIVGVRSRASSAEIRRSLLMGADPYPPAEPGAPPIGVGEGSVIHDAIVDKNARIGRGVRIVNERGLLEADGPGWAIREGVVVVMKNAVIKDGTVI
jgi:glucose-1-phosphate adenylyltransferase